MQEDTFEEELQLGARVCQRCGRPFVLVARTDQQRLALHTRVMQAVVEQLQLPGYLVLPAELGPAQTRVIGLSPGSAARELSQADFAESQEQAFLRHRCAGS